MKNKGFINDKGKLLYDPFYKDSLGMSPKLRRNIKFEDNEENLSEEKLSFKSSGNSPNNKKIIKLELNKYLIGYNKKFPDYNIYKSKINSRSFLPFIKNFQINYYSRNKYSKFYYRINKGYEKFEKNIFNQVNFNFFLNSPHK